MADITFEELVGMDWEALVEYDQGERHVPTGTVLARVESAAYDYTQHGRHVWNLVVVAEGYRFYPMLGFDPNDKSTAAAFFRRAHVLGLEPGYFAQRPIAEKVARDLAGKTFVAKVSHRTDSGTEYPYLTNWRRAHLTAA